MPMSYSTPKPHGWQRDPMRNRRHLRGWVGGKLELRRCLPELVQKWAKTLGIRTVCSNTDAGPAVAFVSLLVRYIPTEIPSAHVLQS